MARKFKRVGARPLAVGIAMCVAFALAVPFSGIASAQPPTGCRLDVEPETDSNPIGTQHVLTATLVDADGAGPLTCTQQNVQDAGGVEVDFEITGPGDTATPGNPVGDNPENPDLTCTITGQGNPNATPSCTVTYTSNAAGTDVIRGFVDADKNNTNNATTDADMTEGQDATATPGAQTEPDRTDVVTKNWFGDVPADATLNCVDESGDDTQVNPVTGAEATETYTCTVFRDTNANGTRDTGEGVIEGVRIDAEIQGVNDPDDRGFTTAGNTTADRDNACTTNAQGQCTIQVAPAENQAGTAQICFFTDANNDAVFDSATNENNGAQCDEENAGNEATNARTDVVTKTWGQPTATNIVLTPDVDNNPAGTQHTVTATVTDQFGNPVAGANVDFYVRGRNTGTTLNVITNQQGQATLTYTDAGPANAQGTDTITGCIDANADDAGVTEVPAAGNNPAQVNCQTGEAEDDALKNWFPTGQVPAPNEVKIDMTPAAAPNECPDTAGSNQFTATATNTVGDAPHRFCIAVFDAAGAPIAGQQVTLSLSGPGNFTNETSTTNTGQQATATTDREGDAIAFLESDTAGTTTITATAGGRTGTATKEFVSAPALARTIDCSPETATNPPGTTHTISCVVTDRFGNPVQGVNVTATEDGPGRFSGASTVATNANGVAEFVITTSTNETGTQTVTASLPGNRTDNTVEECERAAGSPAGTAAGVCSDSVTKTWGGATPTATVTATATPTATTTTTATATVTAPPGGFPRTVNLESSKNKLTYPKTFTLSGTIKTEQVDAPRSCIANVTVTISRDVVGGDNQFVEIATVTTDAEGAFTLNRKADRSANYVAHVDQDGQCSEGNSSALNVLVRVAVGLRLSNTEVDAGDVITARVRVRPCSGHKRTRVILFRVVDGQLTKIAKKRTNNRCVAVFRTTVNSNTAYQARWPKQHEDHLRGKSRRKAVLVR
ncbi:MAG TPA: Ig-like domain-containing protein [Actinomycetota bacterium]|nr:Ig-like domain-containing protein [Actinomycetota bacterium]